MWNFYQNDLPKEVPDLIAGQIWQGGLAKSYQPFGEKMAANVEGCLTKQVVMFT